MGAQQSGWIQFESDWTGPIKGGSSSLSTRSILPPLQSAQSRTGADTTCQAICTVPTIDARNIKAVSIIPIRSEQAIDPGEDTGGVNRPKGILAVLEFQT
jgi:hypothetical protein